MTQIVSVRSQPIYVVFNSFVAELMLFDNIVPVKVGKKIPKHNERLYPGDY